MVNISLLAPSTIILQKKGESIKGFVLDVKRVKNEDSVATILSEHSVTTYYRFFGARHSILQVGNLVDFEVEGEQSNFLPRLRSLSHVSFKWMFDKNKLLPWHNFIKKFTPHLKDAQEIEPFYYELLLNAAKKWHKQNPKRVVCEAYMELLEYEGRVHPTENCFMCESNIGDEIGLMQAFKVAHPNCLYVPPFNKNKFLTFINSKSTIHIEDYEVDYLYEVVMKGL